MFLNSNTDETNNLFLQPIFSCGKNIAAIVVARLVDQELLKYDAQVSDYWPEFAQNGKGGEHITIADVLRHECGLTSLDYTFEWEDFLRDNIKQNMIGSVIERCETNFPQHNFNPDGTESRRCYHAQTRGLVLNEIVRRVDMKSRTIGEILREDINIDGLYCGLPETEMNRVSRLEAKSMGWVVFNSMIPYSMGSKVDFNVFELYKRKRTFDANIKKMGPQQAIIKSANKEPHLRHTIYENKVIQKGEIPSSACNGNARGLAKLASLMSRNKDHVGDDKLLSKQAWEKMHDKASWAIDAYLGIKIIKMLLIDFSMDRIRITITPYTLIFSPVGPDS